MDPIIFGRRSTTGCIFHDHFHLNSCVYKQVFSHMADSYLMKLSSANMSAEDLLAALALARRWNMKTLENNYAHVLSRRISNTTLISVSASRFELIALI